MTQSLPRPALDEASPSTDSAKCPKCGGALRFESDRQGYGQTIEQCEHVARCGHWRTLEGPRIPAHTPRPRETERVRRRAAVASDATREKRAYVRTSAPGELSAAILAALPATERKAVTPAQVATACGRPAASVTSRLFSLFKAGTIASKKLGTTHRAPRLYWRKAA